MTNQADLRYMSEKAAHYRTTGDNPIARLILESAAAEIENKIISHTTAQPVPVCPWCGDRDDDDQHETINQTDASMMVVCVCGKTYQAKARTITVWDTEKYPKECKS